MQYWVVREILGAIKNNAYIYKYVMFNKFSLLQLTHNHKVSLPWLKIQPADLKYDSGSGEPYNIPVWP